MTDLAFTFYPENVRRWALVPVVACSIYRSHMATLPVRMGWMTPDAAEAFRALEEAVRSQGGMIYLSDCYRSSLDQARAHADWLAGNRPALVDGYLRSIRGLKGYLPKPKRAFSPPPGGSFHEAGRAIDVDMDPRWLGMDQRAFSELALAHGWKDIVGGNFGDPERVDVTEEWHWQFPGPFQAVYDQVESMKGRKAATREAVRRAIEEIKEAA